MNTLKQEAKTPRLRCEVSAFGRHENQIKLNRKLSLPLELPWHQKLLLLVVAVR